MFNPRPAARYGAAERSELALWFIFDFHPKIQATRERYDCIEEESDNQTFSGEQQDNDCSIHVVRIPAHRDACFDRKNDRILIPMNRRTILGHDGRTITEEHKSAGYDSEDVPRHSGARFLANV
ncbi:hypothetical protein K0B96_01270 [Horticoccus luteus]|uniref:Uncharacterized protein n=1 Tax=Horticoccus luteus TaxID=2862869 RepID=A0A8F9TXD2_9BACT|nr:hypothetical protein [Horticoccus luteus]QYM79277.1 hypothetical protein K0B96_01270 [Horticoccus luteus]